MRNDPYETTDAVFGVKDSLLVDLGTVDEAMAKRYGVEAGIALMTYEFVLVSEQESTDLRNKRSIQALQKLGRKVVILDGLPVPQVD